MKKSGKNKSAVRARISIDNLRVSAAIGVLDWERQARQTLLISVVYAIDMAQAAQTDCVTDTVSYADVRACIIKLVARRRFGLLESLASCLLDTLQKEFSLSGLRIKISKPGVFADVDEVAVTVEQQ